MVVGFVATAAAELEHQRKNDGAQNDRDDHTQDDHHLQVLPPHLPFNLLRLHFESDGL